MEEDKKKSVIFKKSHIIFLVVFFLSVIGLQIWKYHWPEATLLLNTRELRVLVAKTPYHLYKGLGKRDNLGEYDGMVFLFPVSRRQGIVMRDMRFPLDIVWVNNGTVVDIAPDVPIEPEASEAALMVYYPRENANVVLELRAGWTGENGTKIGDRLRLGER